MTTFKYLTYRSNISHLLYRRTAAIMGFMLCMLIAATAPSWSYAEVNYETISFIKSNGHEYTNYTTTRSDGETYAVFIDKSESLSDFLFINPNTFTYDESPKNANALRFKQGSYALLSNGDYVNTHNPENSQVKVDQNGIYTLKSWDGQKLENGHFGHWNSPEDFTSFAAAWVLPESFEIMEYFANRQGEWVQRGNTLAFFGENINDITFELRYRAKTQTTFIALQQQLSEVESAAVEQQDDKVTVILENEILFPSGSALLSSNGLQVIEKLAGKLSELEDQEIVVAGHTDNITITGELAKVFPTNWELSAARATHVVHVLSSAGVRQDRMQVRAFGPFRPRVANTSPENRSANRRIEITIQPLAKSSQ